MFYGSCFVSHSVWFFYILVPSIIMHLELKWFFSVGTTAPESQSNAVVRSFWLHAVWATLNFPYCHVKNWIHSLDVSRTDVSYHDMEVIDKMQSIPDLERYYCFWPKTNSVITNNKCSTIHFSASLLLFCDSALCSVFAIDLLEPKRGILLELYVQTVLFCREHSLNKEQTSALLSIIKSIHSANIGE